MLEPMNVEANERLGRYEILEEIGRGAMGVVYLAQDPLIGRRVALKVFRVGFSASDDELRNLYSRFIREAQSAGILSHPHIVTVHDVAQSEGDSPAFIAMEYVEGRTLKQLLDSPEPISRPRAVRLLLQVAEALDYAHSMGVVHRDIKPGNILVTADDQVKITDFGIALVNAGNITNHGQLLGTPNYMSPEAIEEDDVDHRADLFSLGVVLYELLTRHKPFAGKNMTKVTHRIVYEPFTPPTEYVADLPAGLVEIVGRALEKDPADRYQTAGQVRRALEQALEHEATLEPRAPLDKTASVDIDLSDETPASADTQSVELEAVPPAPTRRRLFGQLGVLLRRPVLKRLPVWLLAAGILTGATTGYLLSRSLAAGAVQALDEGAVVVPVQVGALEPLVERVAGLEAEAVRLAAAGDLEGARSALVEAVRLDGDSARLLDRLRQAETQLRVEREQWTHQVEEHLAAARRSLSDGRIRDSVEFARRALELDPMNLEGPDILAAGRMARARIEARREAMSAPTEPEVAVPVVVEPEVEPTPPPVVETSRPAEPLATTGTLVVDLRSARSPGVLTLYLGEEQIFRERFKFVGEKKGLLRTLASRGGAGELRRELEREPGNLELRLYVSMPGQATQVIPVSGRLVAGGTKRLSVVIEGSGRARARFE